VPILAALMMQAIRSSETSALTRTTQQGVQGFSVGLAEVECSEHLMDLSEESAVTGIMLIDFLLSKYPISLLLASWMFSPRLIV
jgi:hypothetical protein